MSLASLLALAACSAKGGGGYGGPTDDDAGDASAPTDGAPSDAPAPLDGVASDTPAQPDVPVTSDTPTPFDSPSLDTPPPTDMPAQPRCGDRICNGDESCRACPMDCGECPPPPDVPVELYCGDGVCTASRDESCSSCPRDCGTCPPPPDVPPTCESSTCGGCVTSSGCGWCSFAGTGLCVPGNSSGPLGGTPCPGTWVAPGRTSSCTTTTDAGPPDVPTTNPTVACTSSSWAGTSRECNWRVSGTLSCSPGRTYTIGCNSTSGTSSPCTSTIGVCSGDPVMRVCSGSTYCSYSGAIANIDDTCGTCPVTTITCPSSGLVTVLTGSYDSTRTGTCSPSLR